MLLILALLMGCTETENEIFDQCAVQGVLVTAEVSAGDEVVVAGGPFTEVYDTMVQVDGTDAEVVAVERTDCADCDDCLALWDCGPCRDCEHDCDDTCLVCMETTTFVVPEVAAGTTSAVLLNRYGSTSPLTLEVVEVQE